MTYPVKVKVTDFQLIGPFVYAVSFKALFHWVHDFSVVSYYFKDKFSLLYKNSHHKSLKRRTTKTYNDKGNCLWNGI